ncbi:hypothetical protein HYV81_04685 [Candidatus Woesearchaeota archaeon]|nr:hypothetical protein [Candidatus Woesearchaeota archaeon]
MQYQIKDASDASYALYFEKSGIAKVPIPSREAVINQGEYQRKGGIVVESNFKTLEELMSRIEGRKLMPEDVVFVELHSDKLPSACIFADHPITGKADVKVFALRK